MSSLKAMTVILLMLHRSRVHQLLLRDFFLAQARIVHNYLVYEEIFTGAVQEGEIKLMDPR